MRDRFMGGQQTTYNPNQKIDLDDLESFIEMKNKEAKRVPIKNRI